LKKKTVVGFLASARKDRLREIMGGDDARGALATGLAAVTYALYHSPACGMKGEERGSPYSMVRGEILRPMEDAQERKQSPSASPLIKNESMGIEDDQIPS